MANPEPLDTRSDPESAESGSDSEGGEGDNIQIKEANVARGELFSTEKLATAKRRLTITKNLTEYVNLGGEALGSFKRSLN